MQIEGVDAQHDEESQGAGIEREVVAEGRLAEQQNGEHEGGAHQGGRQTREEGVAPEGDGDDEIADPSPTEGKHVLEGKKLEHQNDDADMEARKGQHVADSCMGVGCARFFGYVGFSSDGHGFDDGTRFSIDAVVIVDGVQCPLHISERGEEILMSMTRLDKPPSLWCVCCGTDTIVEEIIVVGLEGVVGTCMGGIEVSGRGEDGVTNRRQMFPLERANI